MKGTGIEMQMLSWEARRSGRPSMGQVPEKTLPDPGGQAATGAPGWLGHLLWPWPGPTPQPGAQRTHYPGHKKGSFLFHREDVAASWELVSASYFSLLSSPLTFMPASPGRPGSPTAPGGPCKKKKMASVHSRARAGPWLPREEITEAGSEKTRDEPKVAHPEIPSAGSRLQPLGA